MIGIVFAIVGRLLDTYNLIILHTYIFDFFHENGQVDVIYTDFAKAFNHVNHSMLKSTLDSIDIGEPHHS